MQNTIEIEINQILEETTKFDFPFWANEKKRKIIFLEKKLYIEEKFKNIMPKHFPNKEKNRKNMGRIC